MARILVSEADFDVGAEIALLTAGRTDIGGIGCFIGTVRDAVPQADAPVVSALTLEHYPAMTERAIGRIVAEAERRWTLLGCTVIHRVGRLAPGENIVLKTKAPFWKREEFIDGASAWVEAKDSDDAAAERWT